MFAGEQLTHQDVKEESDMAAETAKDGLKHQFIQIESANWLALQKAQPGRERGLISKQQVKRLYDLFWTAINASLLNKPIQLQDRKSGYWISEGFALVEEIGGTAVTMILAERLAIDAVIDYLKSDTSGYSYDDEMITFIFGQQFSKVSIGLGAEIFLAWVRAIPER
jgi:hypothetical protein